MPAASKIVAIVDDTPLLRRGLRSLIMASPSLTLGFEATTPADALPLLEAAPPDLIISEVVFRSSEGIFELLRDVQAHANSIPVLAFSHFDERVIATRVLQAGAQGYLMKSADDDQLFQAIHHILAGHVHLSPAMTDRTLGRLSRPSGGHSHSSRTDLLTNREVEVLELVGDGRASKEIAETLHICLKTVESHRANIRAKLGLENSAELICYASRWRGDADDRGILTTKSHRS